MVYPVAQQTGATPFRIGFYAISTIAGPARLKRPGDVGDQPRDELGCSEAGYIAIIMGSPERRHQQFIEFLVGFIRELNDLSGDGAMVLVEGKRDAAALVELGYIGGIVTSSTVKSGSPMVRRAERIVILTDLDTEGRRLAARYIKLFSRMGIQTTLAPRGRLSRGSHGKFLHIENLIRFAPLPLKVDAIWKEPAERLAPD
jgi:5S rRNA maturation endonuclease (ribonuclease M5)